MSAPTPTEGELVALEAEPEARLPGDEPPLGLGREDPVFATRETRAKWIANYIRNVHEAEKEARHEVEDIWEDCKDLLENRHNFGERADWQSRLVVAKVPNAINASLAILKNGITQTKDWFDLQVSDDPLDQALAKDFKDLLRAEIEERDPGTQRDFIDEWIFSLKAALTCGPLTMKVYPQEEMRRIRAFEVVRPEPEDPDDPGEALAFGAAQAQTGGDPLAMAAALGRPVEVRPTVRVEKMIRIAKKFVDPFRFYPDSTGRGKYEIQEIDGDVDDLNFLSSEAGYDEEALRRVVSKAAAGQRKEDEDGYGQREDEIDPARAGRVTWDGLEYWGDIPGPDGQVIERGVVATVIEGELVRLSEGPFDGESPFCTATIEPMPWSESGRGLVESNAGIARFIIELTNAIVDAVTFEVLKQYEVDVNLVADSQDVKEGVKPGKVWLKRSQIGDEAARRLITPVDSGQVPSDVLGLMSFMDRLFQEGTSVNELTQGLGPIRGFPTATEIGARQQGSNVTFRSIAQWMEKTSLEPCLGAIFDRMLDFKVFGDGGPEWVSRVLGPQRASQFYNNITTRLAQGQGQFDLGVEFRVTALTSILAKAAELERLAQFVQAIQGFPGFANRVRLDQVAKKVVEALGYGSEDLVKSDEELAQVEAMERQVLANLAQQAGQQPLSNSGLSAAAASAAAPSGT